MPNRDHFFKNQVSQRFSVEDYLALMDRFVLQSSQFGNLRDTRDLMRMKMFFECNQPSTEVFRDSIAIDLISGSFSDERFLCSRESDATDDAFIISVIEEFGLQDKVEAAGHEIRGGKIVCFNDALYKAAVDRFYAHFNGQDENMYAINSLTAFMDSVSDEEVDEEISQLTVVAPRLRLL